MSNLDFYIAFYACKEARERLLYLLKRCITSARREKIDNLYVIDGSEQQAMLKPSEVDAETIRNKKHSLACATNIAIEKAEHLMFLSAHAAILGVGLIHNMLVEKEKAEEQLGKPVALCSNLASYPTADEWFLELPEHDWGRGNTIEVVKQELSQIGFSYTEDGIAISKLPRTNWIEGKINYYRSLGVGYLADKECLFKMGGADERCWCVDTDNGMRWMSFGGLIIISESVRYHRLIHSTWKGCPRRLADRESHFYAQKKFSAVLNQLYNHHAFAEPIRKNPSLYRDNLVSPYQEEYDKLKKKPFFLGRQLLEVE